MDKANNIKWIKVNTYDEMSKMAAAIFEKQLIEKPQSVLGMATGGTPEGFYKELVQCYMKGDISFAEVNTFNLDEYVGIAAEESTSYHNYMYEHLFKHINIPRQNVHLPNGLAEDLEKECAYYDKLIEQNGGIDLQLLGIGVNGHIGFNEPGTSFQTRTHIVELAEKTRQDNAKYFPEEKEVPKLAITMGIETIMEAKRIILLAFGENKIETLKRIQQEGITEEFPASCLKDHPDVMIIYGS